MCLAMKLTLVSSLSLLIFGSGCGGILGGLGGPSGPKVPPVYGPYPVVVEPLIKLPQSQPTGIRELRIQTSLEVAPDRGAIPLYVIAHAGTFDDSAAQVKKAFDDIKKFGSADGCGFQITHYAPPMKVGEKWRSSGTVNLYANVEGLDAEARITRANSCFKGMREYLFALPPYKEKDPAGFGVVPPVLPPFEIWSVEQKTLDKSRDTLVAQANDRFKAVQKADARLWDHADVQCTSAGVVNAVESSSHAVILQLEMLCPVSPAETASDPGTTRKIGK
jgi:hypothetical protein